MNWSSAPSRRSLLLLLLIGALLWFGNLNYRKLINPDEGRYAEIPREMVATGEWITPRLDGIKYFEKPALQYWATATAYEAFGEHQWTARLWSALTGFLGILLTYYAGVRLFGRDAGLFGALVLGSSVLYAAIAHINTLDMGVTFFMGATLECFLLAQRSGASPPEARFWMLSTWVAMALAMLSKGLIGIVLPGGVLVIYTLVSRDWALWRRVQIGLGSLLFFLIAAPWFIAVTWKNPEFFHFFFIHEHFERFLTKEAHRYHPWYTFIPILLLGILPWLAPFFAALRSGLAADGNGKGLQARRLLLIWSVFIFVFFSISDSKLPSYILPIFPALALLIGDVLARTRPRTFFWQSLPLGALSVAGLIYSPFVTHLASDDVPKVLYAHYVPWLIAAFSVWTLSIVATLVFARRDALRPAVLTLALGSFVAGQLGMMGHNSLAPANSTYYLARAIKPYLRPGVPFYSVGMYEQTLPYYINRTVTLVAHRGELGFGLDQQPSLWIPTIAGFERIWPKQPYALAIMPRGQLAPFLHDGLKMTVIARNSRWIIVKTP
ncbi:MAG: glycosyltransferase family 39 protein [Betaproteobacteria bacterium]|nr:glycosyltransferase family 39 protein [Betaproteobacteria bacterium]